jgi:adenylate cyclase
MVRYPRPVSFLTNLFATTSSQVGVPESGRQRRLAAIMFTDMVGSTALAQEDEELSLLVVDEHRDLLRPIFARHEGREVKTMGDGFLVEFPNALDAVKCAYEIQRSARERNFSLPRERRVRLRLGIHLGDVVESGGDISGDAVNVASRVEPLADEGGVCITRQVHDQVKNKFQLPFESLGPKPLKNVAEPVEIFRMVMPWDERAAPPPADHGRIAVLPFSNLSPDPGDEYFADGITEEMITTLSNLSGLSVISRTSIMKYKGKEKSVGEIGRELGVGSVLEGSVRKAGNKVRVTTQLIDVAQDRHLWAQNYDRELVDVFQVQSDIASQVSEALRTRILPAEKGRIERPPTRDMEAFELYLRGRAYWNERSHDSMKKAIKCFENAVSKDPGFALAYAGIANVYNVLFSYGQVSAREALASMESNTSKALELDPELAEAHAALAGLSAYRWDWAGALREIRRSIELNPSYATAHHWRSILLCNLRRLDEALVEMERARELDPLSLIITTALGVVHHFRREYAEAEALHMKALAMDPNFQPALANLAVEYISQGKRDEYAKMFPVLEDSYRGVDSAIATIADGLAFLGRSDEARKLLAEAVKVWERDKLAATDIASVFMRLGEVDETFKWLDVAYRQKDWYLVSINIEPAWDPVRGDPRFEELVSKMGLSNLPQDA